MANRTLQMSGSRYRGYKDDGTVNSGGLIYFYAAGTTTAKDTYQDAEATTANANPVVLDTRGEADIFGKGAYKIVEKDSDETQLGDAVDGVLLPEITDTALGLLNDATVADMRTTLGLGTAAVTDAGTSAGNVLLLAATDVLPALDGSALTNIAAGEGPLPYGYLGGFGLSSTASSTTFAVTTGECRDSTNTTSLSLTSAYTKTLGTWALGSTKGSLDTGTVASSKFYHVFAIYNATTKVTDILTSLSPTSPDVSGAATGYETFRRIGALYTDTNPYIVAFSQFGDQFLWADPPIDISTATLGATAANEVLTVPTGVKVQAIVQATAYHASSAISVYLSSPDANDEAPAGDTTSPIGTIVVPTAGKRYSCGVAHIRTNTSAAIRTRSTASSSSLALTTIGWLDDRGRG